MTIHHSCWADKTKHHQTRVPPEQSLVRALPRARTRDYSWVEHSFDGVLSCQRQQLWCILTKHKYEYDTYICSKKQ